MSLNPCYQIITFYSSCVKVLSYIYRNVRIFLFDLLLSEIIY